MKLLSSFPNRVSVGQGTGANSSVLTEAPQSLPLAAVSPSPAGDPSLYFNRELSWLAFNERVLNEAAAGWPLLERLNFLGIYFSNLDEFFMVRVSALHEQALAVHIDKSPDGLLPHEQLSAIRTVVRSQTDRAASLLAEDLLPQLEFNNIRICLWHDLDRANRESAHRYFRRAVFPVLTPLVVDPVHPFPFLSNLSLSLAVEIRDPDARGRPFCESESSGNPAAACSTGGTR
jgi:polyphosphate kinase